MKDLARLIHEAIAYKRRNKEFALSSNMGWRAEIGNTCSNVRLGESDGEFIGDGDTPEKAVAMLIEVMKNS